MNTSERKRLSIGEIEVSELQAVGDVEVLIPLSPQDATRLDKRLRLMAGTARQNFEKVGRLLDEAKAGRVHDVLGYKSWPAYVADAVGGQIQLSGDSRVAMVQMLAGEGMSVRAIATATGVSKSTVDRDLAQVSHDGTGESIEPSNSGVPQWDTSSPGDGGDTVEEPVDATPEARTTGLDGKTYTKPKRKPRAKRETNPDPEPEPVKERRPQLRTVFRANVEEMERVYQQTHRLGIDPRWEKTTLAKKDVEQLRVLITGLEQLHAVASKRVKDIPTESTGTPEEQTA
jgi:transposase-like protein